MKKIIFIFLLLIVPLGVFYWLTSTNIVVLSTKKQNQTAPVAIQLNDIIGHITIKDTSIDEPITQTTDNEYYLTHNAKKEEDKEGSVFLDYRNQIKDKKLLLYGHNSKTKTAPFKELETYLEETYYKEHPNITLTLQGKKANYIIFSVMLIEKTDYRHTQLKFEEEEYLEHLIWLKESSRYNTNVEVKGDDSILLIQTCYYEPEESYLLIIAKKESQ